MECTDRLCCDRDAITRMSDQSAMVALEQVSFGYGSRKILDNISLRIPRGKVVAIMGGSGCGKTTSLARSHM